MSERHIYAYVKTIPSRHAKEIRAQAIRGRMAVKGLYVPVQADWLSAFYREVLSFPAGKNDDLVDAYPCVARFSTVSRPADHSNRKSRARKLSAPTQTPATYRCSSCSRQTSASTSPPYMIASGRNKQRESKSR
jgi:hypothetical protein